VTTSLQSKRAVFLDAGLTLIYSELSLPQLCVAAASAQGLEITLREVENALVAAASHLWEAHRDDPNLWSSDSTVHKLWKEYYRRIFHEVGIVAEAEQCASAVYVAYDKPGAWRLYDDALPTLRQLHERGYILGIISDWASNLPSGILLPLGLGEYVDFVVVSTVQREGKPGSGLYREALSRARVTPDQAVHVGDNYINDVLGARAAGIDGILLDRHHRHSAPLDCPRIETLLELSGLLDEGRQVNDERRR
jgi:HAD superfamily hydrolase (TIGR01549 family)